MLYEVITEESGLIVAIGNWVIEESFRLLQHYRITDISLSINVSAKQFRQEDIVSQLQYFSDRYEVAPHLIQIELTESAVITSYSIHYTKLYDPT